MDFRIDLITRLRDGLDQSGQGRLAQVLRSVIVVIARAWAIIVAIVVATRTIITVTIDAAPLDADHDAGVLRDVGAYTLAIANRKPQLATVSRDELIINFATLLKRTRCCCRVCCRLG